MNTQDKLAKITAKDFTYVSTHYYKDGELGFDRFVVLTPSKPLARQAAEQIATARTGITNIVPAKGRLDARDGQNGHDHLEISLYPRNYVKWAKNMVGTDPNSVYAVESTTTVQVGA